MQRESVERVWPCCTWVWRGTLVAVCVNLRLPSLPAAPQGYIPIDKRLQESK